MMKPTVKIAFLALGALLWAGCDDDNDLSSQLKDLEGAKAELEAKVQSLEQEKASLAQQKTSLEQEKSSLLGEKTSLEESNQALEDAKAALETDNAALEEAKASLEGRVAGPPAFLDALYPPQAPFPMLLVEMFTLAGAFEGLLIDMQSGDLSQLGADFGAFKDQYNRLRTEVIPEWADNLPLAPVDALETALGTGDPAQVGPAIGAVGAVCGSCHAKHQIKVMVKYHWPDFDKVSLLEPVQTATVPWEQFMMGTAIAYTTIGHELSQGQLDNARAASGLFRTYFNTLKNGCDNCHTTPRQYFVDPNIENLIDSIDAELAQTTPDGAAVGGMLQTIGNEMCVKCHLVHQPPQRMRESWQ